MKVCSDTPILYSQHSLDVEPYISSRRSNRVVSNVLGGMSNGFPASLSEMRETGRSLRLSDSDSD
jgi:hypothetical protein